MRSLPSYDAAHGTLERWLNGITLHVTSHWWSLARHRREKLGSAVPDGVDIAPPADVALSAEEDRLDLLEALQSVLDHLRAVLVAVDLDGVPVAEVAEQRGMPASTVYKWRTRALRYLEEALAKLRRIRAVPLR